ncbi:hypothetical protein [Clostridium estertheticum]|nr:hypothetical protein [Clostridium estertheticum]
MKMYLNHPMQGMQQMNGMQSMYPMMDGMCAMAQIVCISKIFFFY